jgi:hypothetical protein
VHGATSGEGAAGFYTVRGTTTETDGKQPIPCVAPEDRERLIAHIVRDFMTAYGLARRIGVELRAGTLEFAMVDRLVGDVGDSPRSVLFRLKEDCHALFRDPSASPSTEPQATELFDLAVGALFHEAMRFREGYYLYTTYGPRARRSLAESPSGPLAQGFRRLFDAGYRRMLESEAETEELFRETREQLRVLLHEWSNGGEIARSLVADPDRTEAVFSTPLAELLREVFGSASRGYALAIGCLLACGHYRQAAELIDRPGVAQIGLEGVEPVLIRGLAAYYGGNPCEALQLLGAWAKQGADGMAPLRARASAVLRLIAYEVEEDQPALARKALRLEERVTRAASDREGEGPA